MKCLLTLVYTIKKIEAFLEEISKLKKSEFAYLDSQKALQLLESSFIKDLESLNSFSAETDKEAIVAKCTVVLRNLFIYLPVLGFILRSTNIRNAFEVYGPLFRIAKDLLEPRVSREERKTRLILSSEWNYSPYVYRYRGLKELLDFVLIGLPAPESSNPFLIPLSGHELGHVLWSKNRVNNLVKKQIDDLIVNIILNKWGEYVEIFEGPDEPPEDISNFLFFIEHYRIIREISYCQIEETFADFVGLYLFGVSFLHAHAYLLSPKAGETRSTRYPNTLTRVHNLLDAAKNYEIETPDNYLLMFADSTLPTMDKGSRFLLNISDNVLSEMIPGLISTVKSIVDDSDVILPSCREEERIYNRIRKDIVPAEEAATLADILNGAWLAFNDLDLWREFPHIREKKDASLKELILKNIEVFEIEQLGKQN